MKTKGMTTGALLLLLLVSTNCVSQQHRAVPIARWHAPDSSLQDRLSAAQELCPLGTTAAEARRILGTDGRLAHYYGPTVKGQRQKGDLSVDRVADHDDRALEYAVPGGKISLVLELPVGSVDVENAVVTRIRSMKRISITQPEEGKP
jgi:hypothetical protein